MRLDKLLEKAKVGSRGEVKKLLRSRQVRVDGHVATKANLNVDSHLQQITVSGRVVQIESESYLMLHKPAGVLSAVRDKKYQTVIDLIAPKDRKDGIYPIGRLDRDTEGLLLLTTNGPLGFRMLHPRHHVEKTYYVEVNGWLGEDAPHFFEKGVSFSDGTLCQPAQLELLEVGQSKSSAHLTIREGKFHQVKKMFLAYGVKVTYLKRIRFGPFWLDDKLAVGAYRKLTNEECDLLKDYLD